MTSEVNIGPNPEPGPPHVEFDPEIKWPEINQVGVVTPGYLINN